MQNIISEKELKISMCLCVVHKCEGEGEFWSVSWTYDQFNIYIYIIILDVLASNRQNESISIFSPRITCSVRLEWAL